MKNRFFSGEGEKKDKRELKKKTHRNFSISVRAQNRSEIGNMFAPDQLLQERPHAG
jgi:hypothetical protein